MRLNASVTGFRAEKESVVTAVPPGGYNQLLALSNGSNRRYNNKHYCVHGLWADCCICDTPIPFWPTRALADPSDPSALPRREA